MTLFVEYITLNLQNDYVCANFH